MQEMQAIFRAHPVRPAELDAIARCVEACFACQQICVSCADACLSEQHIESLRACITLSLDCADICAATGAVLLRLGRPGPQPVQAQVAACAQACRSCAEECGRHAEMHDHCRICAEACHACHDACEDMLKGMRHAGESEKHARQPHLSATAQDPLR